MRRARDTDDAPETTTRPERHRWTRKRPEADAPPAPGRDQGDAPAARWSRLRRTRTHPETGERPPETPETPAATNRDDQPPARDAKPSRRDARRQDRDEARRDLRRRASELVSHATGRHYERVGFATKGRRLFAYLLLGCVILCVGAMSWNGEYSWAQHHMNWADWHAILAPGSLDLAAMYCTLRGLDRIDRGFSGFTHRVLSAVFVALGAWINWRNELPSGDITKEAFFPVMTIMLYLIIHSEMSATRAEAKLAQHGLKSKERPEPLPTFGILVFIPGIGQPREAVAAWREVIKLRLAKAIARTQLASPATDDEQQSDQRDQDRDDEQDQSDDDETSDAAITEMLVAMPVMADAIRWVLATIPDARESALVATGYLRTHGFPEIASRRVSDIIARDKARRAKSQGDAPETPAVATATGSDSPESEAAS